MATVTQVYAVAYVATILGEDAEMLEAIVSNGGNPSCGAIISVYTGADDTITALTDNGIEELRDMLVDARRSPEHWRNFLENFVADTDVIAHVNEKRAAVAIGRLRSSRPNSERAERSGRRACSETCAPPTADNRRRAWKKRPSLGCCVSSARSPCSRGCGR